MEIQRIGTDKVSPVDESLTPAQLLAAFVESRDQGAFARLLQLYGNMVYGVCRRILRNHHDAEDAFQATFVLLARNAHSIIYRDAITSWLHRVACHTALKSKSTLAIQKSKEVSMSEAHEPTVIERDLWSDLEPHLDQELDQLPDKYRMPLVLCDMQGKTRREAAMELGCLETTLSTRLARARELLAGRLTRQGIVISSATLVILASQNVATAAVPASLLTSTLYTVSSVPVAQAAGSGSVIAKGISLAKSTSLPIMSGKIALVAAIAAGLFVAITDADSEPKTLQLRRDVVSSSSTLDEIRRGIEVSFSYIRNHSFAVEYRTDIEYDNPDRDPLAFLWEEQKLVMEESENKFYGRREAIHRQPDHSDPHRIETTSLDGQIRREHNYTKGHKGSSGFMSVDMKKTGGAWLLDRYLQKIGYAFKPNDLQSSKSDPDNLVWMPACFDKAEYRVATQQESIDGAMCYVVECPGRDQMWIDATHGFALRKRIVKLSQRIEPQPVSMEITNTDLEKVSDGIWLPRRSVVEMFLEADPGKNSKRTRLFRETLVAKSVSVGGPIPPGQFQIEFPVDTFVTDLDKEASYIVKSNGNAVVNSSSEIQLHENAGTVSASPVIISGAHPAFAGESDWTHWLIWANGVLLLIVGGYILYRWRVSS